MAMKLPPGQSLPQPELAQVNLTLKGLKAIDDDMKDRNRQMLKSMTDVTQNATQTET